MMYEEEGDEGDGMDGDYVEVFVVEVA